MNRFIKKTKKAIVLVILTIITCTISAALTAWIYNDSILKNLEKFVLMIAIFCIGAVFYSWKGFVR